MVRIEFQGATFKCTTPDEAVRLYGLLRHGNPDPQGWTPETFWRFLGTIATRQNGILRFLAEKGPSFDWELREALQIKTNQQLAGILSGISKQAEACGIPPRSVFQIDKEFKSGKVIKSYRLATGFETQMKAAIASDK